MPSWHAHASGTTSTRCPSAQTMKAGPRRQLPSSSRCHRVSTRCTGVPHSWQGGDASAIRSARSIASTRRSQARRVACRPPSHAARRSALRRARQDRSAVRAPAGCRACGQSGTGPPSTQRPICRRAEIGSAHHPDRLPWPRRCLCVRIHSGCPRSIPSVGRLEFRNNWSLALWTIGQGPIDRQPTARCD